MKKLYFLFLFCMIIFTSCGEDNKKVSSIVSDRVDNNTVDDEKIQCNILEPFNNYQNGDIQLSVELKNGDFSLSTELEGIKNGNSYSFSNDNERVLIFKDEFMYIQFGYLYSLIYEDYEESKFLRTSNPIGYIDFSIFGEGLTEAFGDFVVAIENGFEVKIENSDQIATCIENYLKYADKNMRTAHEQYNQYNYLLHGLNIMCSDYYTDSIQPLMKKNGYSYTELDGSLIDRFVYSYLNQKYKLDDYSDYFVFDKIIKEVEREEVRATKLWNAVKGYNLYLNVTTIDEGSILNLEIKNAEKGVEYKFNFSITDNNSEDEIKKPEAARICTLLDKKELMESNSKIKECLDLLEEYLIKNRPPEPKLEKVELKTKEGDIIKLAITEQYEIIKVKDDFIELYDIINNGNISVKMISNNKVTSEDSLYDYLEEINDMDTLDKCSFGISSTRIDVHFRGWMNNSKTIYWLNSNLFNGYFEIHVEVLAEYDDDIPNIGFTKDENKAFLNGALIKSFAETIYN